MIGNSACSLSGEELLGSFVTSVITTSSVELSSHPDIFNGDDGIFETSVLVPGLVVIVSELESGGLSAAECTCAGVYGDMEILKFEVGVGVGDGECSGSFFLSSAVTGVSKE